MKRRCNTVVLVGILVSVFLIVFGVLLSLMMDEYFAQRNVLNNGSRATGTVTVKAIDTHYTTEGSELWHRINYTFTPLGWAPLTYYYSSGVDTGLKVGDQIEIAFDPANPALNYPVKYAPKLITGDLVLGIFLALFAGGAASGLALLLMEPLWERRRGLHKK